MMKKVLFWEGFSVLLFSVCKIIFQLNRLFFNSGMAPIQNGVEHSNTFVISTFSDAHVKDASINMALICSDLVFGSLLCFLGV